MRMRGAIYTVRGTNEPNDVFVTDPRVKRAGIERSRDDLLEAYVLLSDAASIQDSKMIVPSST